MRTKLAIVYHSRALDTCAGLHYIASKHVVHRDLALRNLLLAPGDLKEQRYLVKISGTSRNEIDIFADFGMARMVDNEKEYYYSKSAEGPVRWMAPEALANDRWIVKSDIWSLGIVLWELWSYGEMPYTNLKQNKQVIVAVTEGKRLACPASCPLEIFEIIQSCWSHKPDKRPSAQEIYDQFQSAKSKVFKQVIPTYDMT